MPGFVNAPPEASINAMPQNTGKIPNAEPTAPNNTGMTTLVRLFTVVRSPNASPERPSAELLNVIIMVIMLALVSLFPLSFINYGRNVKVIDPYLGGANKDNGIQFTGAAGTVRDMSMQNYYLADVLHEAKMMKAGVIFACIFLVGLLLKVVCS